jgi:hypothetical protein
MKAVKVRRKQPPCRPATTTTAIITTNTTTNNTNITTTTHAAETVFSCRVCIIAARYTQPAVGVAAEAAKFPHRHVAGAVYGKVPRAEV